MAPSGGLFATQRCHWGETQRGRYDRYAANIQLRASGARPAVDLLIEQREGNGSVAEHRVVELAQIEPRPERASCPLAQAHDLALASHVGERLPRPGDVAVDFVPHMVARGRSVGVHEVDRLLTRPAQVVHA